MDARPPGRFLFAMFQGGGNIPLIMPIVAALVRRGHDVRLMAGPGIRGRSQPVTEDFLRRIGGSGATRVPFEAPDVDPYVAGPPRRGLALGWTPKRLEILSARMARTTLWSQPWAANVLNELKREPVDVLVCDYWLFGAIAAGEAAGVPTAVIVHNAFPPVGAGQPPKGGGFMPARTPLEALGQAIYGWACDRIWRRDGAPAHNAVRRTLGLPAFRSPLDEYDRPSRLLVLGYASFDFPAKALKPPVRYVGTPIDDADVSPDAWTSPWPKDDPRPLVLVSMSTLQQGQAPAMHRIVDAIGGMDVRGLVTLGPALNRDDFRAANNVKLEQFVAHSAVLPHAAAIVSQCGLSTLTKALRHGVPLVCIPLLGDQPDNAARIVSKGAGVRISPDASPEEIRAALNQVLEDTSFRDAARRLGEPMIDDRPDERAAVELESLV
ncbi:MAG: glycosyltransferase family 1 protein [Chloroflexi bacterium]|nr:glycosyltransferase family 1 protein [Chloroflexota bacterium]